MFKIQKAASDDEYEELREDLKRNIIKMMLGLIKYIFVKAVL